MKKFLFLAILVAAPALAEAGPNPPIPPSPTVTLTQAELQALIQAESAKAVESFTVQSAKPVYDKLREAFAVKSQAKSSSPQPQPPH